MRARLTIHVREDLSVTAISYDLHEDHGELVRTWVGAPEIEDCAPYAALSDLLARLGGLTTPLTLFP